MALKPCKSKFYNYKIDLVANYFLDHPELALPIKNKDKKDCDQENNSYIANLFKNINVQNNSKANKRHSAPFIFYVIYFVYQLYSSLKQKDSGIKFEYQSGKTDHDYLTQAQEYQQVNIAAYEEIRKVTINLSEDWNCKVQDLKNGEIINVKQKRISFIDGMPGYYLSIDLKGFIKQVINPEIAGVITKKYKAYKKKCPKQDIPLPSTPEEVAEKDMLLQKNNTSNEHASNHKLMVRLMEYISSEPVFGLNFSKNKKGRHLDTQEVLITKQFFVFIQKFFGGTYKDSVHITPVFLRALYYLIKAPYAFIYYIEFINLLHLKLYIFLVQRYQEQINKNQAINLANSVNPEISKKIRKTYRIRISVFLYDFEKFYKVNKDLIIDELNKTCKDRFAPFYKNVDFDISNTTWKARQTLSKKGLLDLNKISEILISIFKDFRKGLTIVKDD